MGTVKEIRGNHLTVAGVKSFNNGDGCAIWMKTESCRVSASTGWRTINSFRRRCLSYQALARCFTVTLTRSLTDRCNASLPSASCRLSWYWQNNFGFTLTLTDEDDNSVSVVLERGKELARTPQTDNLRNSVGQIGKYAFRTGAH